MDIKKLITDLRICADDDIICPACERYHEMKEKGGTAECVNKLLRDAAAALEKMPQWIPGKKRPKEWKDEKGDAINFLAVIPGVGIDIANWVEPTRCWFCMGVPCKVTHWMPLPEPPKEDV